MCVCVWGSGGYEHKNVKNWTLIYIQVISNQVQRKNKRDCNYDCENVMFASGGGGGGSEGGRGGGEENTWRKEVEEKL